MITRRDLLKTGGALIVSFTFAGRRALSQDDIGKPLATTEVDSFLAIRPDGSVTIYCGKIDCGTGLRIAVRQMVAEELGVPVDRISMLEGDTGLTPDQGSTGGSTGLTRGGSEIRQAAATAREALIAMGAAQYTSCPAGRAMRLFVARFLYGPLGRNADESAQPERRLPSAPGRPHHE